MTSALSSLGKAIANGIVLAAFVGMVLLLAIPRVTGGAILAVTSGSMTPTIPVGSLVLVLPHEGPIEVGDVVTFPRLGGDGELVTHRVSRVIHDGNQTRLATKGDANQGPDHDLVLATDVIGTVTLTIPFLGTVMEALRSPLGLAVLAVVVGLALLNLLRGWSPARLESPLSTAEFGPARPSRGGGNRST